MIIGLYSAASALVIASEQQGVTPGNLANSKMHGYHGAQRFSSGLIANSAARRKYTGDIVGASNARRITTSAPDHFIRPDTLRPSPWATPTASSWVERAHRAALHIATACLFRTSDGRLVAASGVSASRATTAAPSSRRTQLNSRHRHRWLRHRRRATDWQHSPGAVRKSTTTDGRRADAPHRTAAKPDSPTRRAV